jgi:flagellar biosynthesis/type III secretory pathway chaperone
MKTELLELEKVLEQEIEAYSKLENYIVDKRNSLIEGNLEKLKYIDLEIEKFSNTMRKIEKSRLSINKKLGKENMTLKEVVRLIDDKSHSEKLSELGDDLLSVATRVRKQNNISNDLIKHGLRLVEGSIKIITNVLVPESSAYNNYGKAKKPNSTISSIIEEA